MLLLPLLRYDVIWYIGIAQHGYGHRPGDTAFHPLYPLLTGLLGRMFGGKCLLAAWLIAQVCCVTDDEMYNECCYNVQVRYALGSRHLGEGYFDLRTLYYFRERLARHMQATGENLRQQAFEQVTDEQ